MKDPINMKTNQIMNKLCLFSVFVVRVSHGTKTCQAQEYFFTTLARLLPATSALAQRVVFPLLFLGAGLVLVQPSMVPGSARNWDCS